MSSWQRKLYGQEIRYISYRDFSTYQSGNIWYKQRILSVYKRNIPLNDINVCIFWNVLYIFDCLKMITCLFKTIGFILLYFKMAVMPPILETKMADIGKLISLGNLLARKTTWLVLTTTSTTTILSSIFGAYYMTKIVCKYSHLPTLILFLLWLPERTLSLSQFQLTVNTLFLFFYIWHPAVNCHENVYSL